MLYFRDEGVIFTITLWQWCLEALFNLITFIFQIFLKEKNRMVDHTFLLMCVFMSCIVLPTFYFTSGRAFRRVLKTEGFVSTMWKAYTHNLNWEWRLKNKRMKNQVWSFKNADWRLKYEDWRMMDEDCKMKDEEREEWRLSLPYKSYKMKYIL